MSSKAEQGTVPILEGRATYNVPEDHNCVRFDVEWTTKSYGLICDLDLVVYCYDERARFIEVLDGGTKRTRDGSCVLLADQDSASMTSNVFKESLKIDFRLVDKETTAILLYLDGGPRNFQFVQAINASCNPIALRANVPGQAPPPALVQFGDRTRKDYQGVSLCVLYKDGFIEGTDNPMWVCKRIVEPSFTSNKKTKEELVHGLVVANVPCLEKFKPRLFASVNDICSCLSSAALPKLKKKFTAYAGGLQMGRFTEVIFKQLYTKFPQIADANESAYTVAMIQEMFQQIDYNGDGGADWDEFTTFCIQTASEVQGSSHPQGVAIDEYVIEYAEDALRRDTVLSPYRQAALMRFIPAERRFLVIPDESDRVVLMDEKFKIRGEINPYNIQIKNNMGVKEADPSQMKTSHKIMIYDVIFLENKELYAFSASDHSITIVREQGGVGNRKASQVLYNRLFHDLLHMKLCWSNRHDILCSVSSTRVIYGWSIDKSLPLFQVSRHSDIVTDFICVDNLDVFVTSSMDKKIVMWSATSRRVKGIFLGHKRGVRTVSVHETTMLSAGFEVDARTWDLNTKESVAILKGHRFPIVAAKLMCDGALSERDYRAVTVDEGGEIRLWNIFVKERSSSAVFVPTLQVFEMSNPMPPTKYIRFLAIPYNPNLSTSYYSNLVTMGTKMMNFIPERNAKEFVPPSAAEFNSTAAELATCVGKSLYKYDVCKGVFSHVFSNLYSSDLCSICLDGPRGRRMYIGTGNGDVLLVNYLSGQIIDKVSVHKKEVNSICCYMGATRNSIFTASADGCLSILEESHGSVHVHSLIEKTFGGGIGAASVKGAPSVLTMVAISTTNKWGLWNCSTGKKIAIFNEIGPVSSVEIIGASRDAIDLAYLDKNFSKIDKHTLQKRDKEKLLTVAIAKSDGVSIYTLDVSEIHGVNSFFLSFSRSVFMTSLQLMRYPDGESVNYAANAKSSSMKEQSRILSGLNLMATTEDGHIIVWDIERVRTESEKIYRKRYRDHSGSVKSKPAKTSHSMFVTQEGDGAQERENNSRPGTAGTAGTADSADSTGTGESVTVVDSASFVKGSLTSSSAGHLADREADHFFVHQYEYRGDHGDHGHHLPQSFLQKSKPVISWLAHKDTISVSVPMHEHSCLVTISHDGFHRVWNLDKVCLGEMQLPNLTDKLKNPKDPIVEKSAWKFILEKMMVTATHHELAIKLTEMVTKYKDKGRGKARRSATHTGGVLADDIAALQVEDGKPAEEDEQERLRQMALGAMVEKIGPREDGPPLALPSDDELRLRLLQEKLDAHAMKTKHHHGDNNINLEDGEHGAVVLDPGTAQVLEGLHAPRERGDGSVTSATSTTFSDLPPRQYQPELAGPALAVSPIKTKQHFGANTKKALWSIASDNLKDNPSVSAIAPAFSEDSLALSMSEGCLDEESYSLLRGVSLDKNKVHQYSNNKKGVVLLRSPSLSTSIELPALETMRRAEMSFGPQKDYYKNAEKFLNERDNIKKDKMRHAITLGRIESNVKRLGSMVHLVDPLQVDHVAIPDDNPQKDFQKKLDMQTRKMQLRLMASHNIVESENLEGSRRSLDKKYVEKILGRVEAAVNPSHHEKWDLKYSASFKKSKTAQNLPQEAREALEKKVRAALRDEYNAKVRKEEKQKELEVAKLMRNKPGASHSTGEKESPGKDKKLSLDTRALLPYYKAEDVRYFMDIFTKVDEDFSGDLDMKEWIKLFGTLSSGVSVQEARSIFMKFKNEDGLLTVNELVPVVFNKATKDQHKMIIKFCQAEIMKTTEEMTYLTFNDIDSFFESLDDSNLGFVAIITIREKIRSFQLPESCIINFLSTFKDIEDDEMVNNIEFSRLFKNYISRADIESQRKA